MKNIFSKIKFHSNDFSILYILLAGFVFRVFLANFGTLQLDYGTFVAWSNNLVSSGFRQFYNGWSDYLPGYLYVLWFLGKVNIYPAFQTILFKLPAILSDLGVGYLIYKIVAQKKDKKWATGLTLAYIFNPAIFANSTLWGQVDSLTIFFALLAIYLFRKNLIASSVFLALGTLIKPQAAFVLPSILYLFITQKTKLSSFLVYAFTGLIVFVAGFIPFNNQSGIFDFILKRLSVSAGQYPYGSVNAFSFWGFFGFWKPDQTTLWVGIALSIVIVFLTTFVVLVRKQKNQEYYLAGFSLFVTFLFLTRMHERHLLPVLAPLLISSSSNPLLLLVYFGISATYLANLSYAYFWITDNFKEIFNPVLIRGFIVTNLMMLITFFTACYKNVKFSFFKLFDKNRTKYSKLFKDGDIKENKSKWILAAILAFSIFARVYSLGLPENEYFDEVYHAFTAKLILHNDPKAWEWWNPHPEGFAYEWTHPPLAKLGMVLGMVLFGENAFGWRIVQAILGSGCIYLLYLLVYQIFKDRKTALLSSFVLSLDGLFLVMNRIGMNDTYLIFFTLLSIYLFLKDRHFLSAIAYGLALSSKWSALYAIPIFLVSHFAFGKKVKISYLWFIILPVLVYVGSYTVMFATGHSWEQFLEVQKQMWWYHTNLDAEHPYTSPAWTWPFLVRPIYLFNGPEVDQTVSRIYAFGNPAIFWFVVFSILLSFYFSYKEKIKSLGFVIFSYLIFFVPWFVSPRIMFLYHYLPSIPFLAIACGFTVRRFPKMTLLFFIPSLLLFIYFYPHWVGLTISEGLDKSYYWFSSWR